jgi:hypothetical protein
MDSPSPGPRPPAAHPQEAPGPTPYYNGPATIQRKTKLGRLYGGVMIWHLAADAPPPHSLLDVIAAALIP